MFSKDYFSKDIFEFLLILKKHFVKFVLVGGEAVIYYGSARLTGDIDIYYEISDKNSSNLWDALLEFWDNDIPIIQERDELLKSGMVFQFGLPPNRIDLINSISGVEFNEVWKNKKGVDLDLGNGDRLEIYLIGIKELIKNKEASARHKDLEDIKYLKALKIE